MDEKELDTKQSNSIKRDILTFAGALLCCFLWGSAFPYIKIGYKLWNIGSEETWRIIRFAGVRFTLAGILVIIFGSIIKRKVLIPTMKEIPLIFSLSLFQTIGQYIFFYLGLAYTSGVNSAVVNSSTAFFAIIIAALVFRNEKLTFRKVLGCILGFTGVVLINVTSGGFSGINLGDILVIFSALCYGVSSNLIKSFSKEHDTVLFSGYQFVMGGIVMVIVGAIGGAASGEGLSSENILSVKGIVVLIYLALISSVAYTLWGILLRTNNVSKISIFGFMTPIFGVVLSAILLGEYGQLGIKYILALLFVSAGIIIVNIRDNK